MDSERKIEILKEGWRDAIAIVTAFSIDNFESNRTSLSNSRRLIELIFEDLLSKIPESRRPAELKRLQSLCWAFSTMVFASQSNIGAQSLDDHMEILHAMAMKSELKSKDEM